MPEQNNKRIWFIRIIDKNGSNLSNARHKISGQFKAGGGDEKRCQNKKKDEYKKDTTSISDLFKAININNLMLNIMFPVRQLFS